MDRPEHELLLACARIGSENDRGIRRLLQAPLDWPYLLEQAHSTRMSSMLYRRLYALCPEKIPAAALDRLRTLYLMRSARNLLLSTELLRILALFDREKIPAVPFKGPVLAAQLYEDPALREFNDLDILVPRPYAFQALHLLESLGYPALPEFSAAAEAGILEHDLHYKILKPGDNLAVEIHWTLVPEYFRLDLPIDDWWQRMAPVSFEKRPVLAFAREDLLMVLALQVCKHGFQNLQWLGDLARFLDQNPDLDWDLLLKTCSPDLRHILFVALSAAHEGLNAPLPESLLEEIMIDSAALALAREGLRNPFKPGGKLRMLFFQFRLKATLAGRIGSLLSYIFTPVTIDYQTRVPRVLRLLISLFHRNPETL